ncbi:MAG: flagellar hook capping FlgD N-terminal domain-containing protein [Paracoccaceae bacterium]
MDTAISGTLAPDASTAGRNAAANRSEAEKASSDFETFLTLLTAQLRNQDPLQPLDSTQFVAQLASFSAVEQQVKTNDILRAMAAAAGAAQPQRLAGLVGMEVPAPVARRFEGTPLEVRFHPVAGALRAELTVRDSAGAVVAHVPADPVAGQATWDGGTANGGAAAGALFRFAVESFDETASLGTQPGLVFAPVTQVLLDGPEPRLGFAGGISIGLPEAQAVRAPGG